MVEAFFTTHSFSFYCGLLLVLASALMFPLIGWCMVLQYEKQRKRQADLLWQIGVSVYIIIVMAFVLSFFVKL